MFRLTILILLITTVIGFSQLIPNEEEQKQKIIEKYTTPVSPENQEVSLQPYLVSSIDEDEYIVDSGDIFIIKIDVKGPALKIFQSTVTPDGYIVLPDVPSIKVKYLRLNEAKDEIRESLQNSTDNALVEVFLFQLHAIEVNVLGGVHKPGKQKLASNSRLNDAIQSALKYDPSDSVAMGIEKNRSLRRVKIRRSGKTLNYDLLKFRYTGDLTQNPYLMNGDVIFVPYLKKGYYSVAIGGAVGENREFEYLPGETVEDLIEFAGGLPPVADSNAIDLYRFRPDQKTIEKTTLEYSECANYELRPDDRVYVRYKFYYHPKFKIEIDGEVKYPGTYPIEDGITRLSEIIKRAGGFSDRADIGGSKLIRREELIKDKELNRLKRTNANDLSDREKVYLRLRTRENLRIVTVDFEKLFIENKESEDVVLRDGDMIMVPENLKLVFVSGGVISPGNVSFNAEFNYEDYIKSAGGFTSKAKKSETKIIRSKTGNWLEAKKDIFVEEGDIIFVPEKKETDWWVMFKDVLGVATQVGTIVLIMLNINKL